MNMEGAVTANWRCYTPTVTATVTRFYYSEKYNMLIINILYVILFTKVNEKHPLLQCYSHISILIETACISLGSYTYVVLYRCIHIQKCCNAVTPFCKMLIINKLKAKNIDLLLQ